MNTKKHSIFITTVTALGMVAAANGTTIFNATTSNSSDFFGGINGDDTDVSLSGATPDLNLAIGGGNFFVGGFSSNDNINTLNGTALTAADTLTMTVTVDGILHTGNSEIRSRGFEWGMATSATIANGAPLGADNFILRVGGAGNGTTMSLQNSFGTLTSTPFRPTEASVNDGFGVTLVADAAGFTFSFTGLTAQTGTVADLTGTFAAGEFEANFGAGRYFTSVQRRDSSGSGGTATIDYSEASIAVVPEPSSAALLGLAGLALLIRRRK